MDGAPIENQGTEQAGSSAPGLQSSNLEIKIRTMNSDIESIQKGGGLLGIEEKINISIPQTPVAKEPHIESPEFPHTTSVQEDIASGVSAPKSKTPLYVGLGAVGIAILFALGYFLPSIFGSKKSQPRPAPQAPAPIAPTSAQPVSNSTSSAPQPAPATSTPPASITHQSFFASPADASLNVNLVSGTSSPLAIWNSAAKLSTSTFIELAALNGTGGNFAWNDFLSALNIQTVSLDIFNSNLEKDFTAFVYRDKKDIYPGYVLKLQKGTSALLASSDIRNIEKDSAFISFLVPGIQAAAFKDVQIAGQVAREVNISSARNFVYGWFKNKYLIIASSEAAIQAAMARL